LLQRMPVASAVSSVVEWVSLLLIDLPHWYRACRHDPAETTAHCCDTEDMQDIASSEMSTCRDHVLLCWKLLALIIFSGNAGHRETLSDDSLHTCCTARSLILT
jgi:hypothetical protein